MAPNFADKRHAKMESLPSLPKARQRWILHLHTKRHRDREQCFIAEGTRTLVELLRSKYEPVLVVCTKRAADEHAELLTAVQKRNVPLYTADDDVFERLADTRTPQGMLAVVRYPPHVHWKGRGNWIALDGISDPGNAGTIVRTAHWFGYTGVIVGSGSVDRYQPKFVRATMGALFHVHVLEEKLEEFLPRAAQTHRIIGATTRGGVLLRSYCAPTQPHVVVVGSEAHGLQPAVEALLHDRVTIEGSGNFDSLNAAVAAAIVMYHLHTSR